MDFLFIGYNNEYYKRFFNINLVIECVGEKYCYFGRKNIVVMDDKLLIIK